MDAIFMISENSKKEEVKKLLHYQILAFTIPGKM